MKPTVINYTAARHRIRNGDLLLFRPRGLIWRAIAVAGRSDYTHAAMAVSRQTLMLLLRDSGPINTFFGVLARPDAWWVLQETTGSPHIQSLDSIVEEWPGIVDVYETNPRDGRHHCFSKTQAVAAMVRIIQKPYGWASLALAALYHIPVVRFFVRPNTRDNDNSRRSPFCSQAVAMACRKGGFDPVKNLADAKTEPGDLARSPFFKYRFTLG